ncbi:DNA-binding protein [Edwardsiella tarda]|uniref:DNA-binding protein n=1 Tax=Edwardsiella tarda TaxID=636 RepID=UPI00063BDBAD|nr:DNA-binding protein [Edwardsiella tarda]AKH88179.1 DNA-binding protein [Edwardsiella tarda]
MTPQLSIPAGKDVMTYDEFAEVYGYSVRTVKQMVSDGDLLLMPRKKEGAAARINMVAFRARLLQQGISCKYVAC